MTYRAHSKMKHWMPACPKSQQCHSPVDDLCSSHMPSPRLRSYFCHVGLTAWPTRCCLIRMQSVCTWPASRTEGVPARCLHDGGSAQCVLQQDRFWFNCANQYGKMPHSYVFCERPVNLEAHHAQQTRTSPFVKRFAGTARSSRSGTGVEVMKEGMNDEGDRGCLRLARRILPRLRLQSRHICLGLSLMGLSIPRIRSNRCFHNIYTASLQGFVVGCVTL